MQNEAGLAYGCPEAREELAFKAQDQWLRLFGDNLEGAFGINGISLLVKTKCFH